MNPTVGIAVITHTAKKHLPYCLPPLLNSPLKPRVLVVNSSSEDGTVELAEELGAETLVIPRKEFNHGSTREKARLTLGTDIVVMITPDAYAKDVSFLEKLIDPIVNNQASVAYARQVSHNKNNFFETFPREFNYPKESHIRGIKDLPKYGIYTFFCSNSCAAYSNRALNDVGGFPSVLLGEDTVTVAKLLHKGEKIAYVSDAEVKHSHAYNLKQEFQRHFDTGLARSEYRDLIAGGGKDSHRGKEYVRQMFKTLAKDRPLLIPYAFVQTGVKWLGYQVGSRCVNAPLAVKKLFTSQDFYWDSEDFLNRT